MDGLWTSVLWVAVRDIKRESIAERLATKTRDGLEIAEQV